MKRVSQIVATVILLACSNAFSQTTTSIGVQGGVNFANAVTGPVSMSTTARTGLSVGGFVEIGLSGMFFLDPGVSYVQKGAEYEASFFGTSISSTFKFDYVEIPVLLKAKLMEGSFRPYVFAGPDLGLNVNAEGEITAFGQTQNSKIDSTSSVDFCLDFGAGGEFALNANTALFADVRYSLGLTNIDNTSTESWKSTGIQIMVGVKFAL